MNPMDDELPHEARKVLARARRVVTRHQDRATVWHIWGDGQPTLLLHGGSGSWTHWIFNIDALANVGRMVLVPDMPGFGDSELPRDGHDIDALVEPIMGGLRALIGAQPYDLIGFSLGSVVATLTALRDDPRVQRMILVAPPALVGAARAPAPFAAWKHLGDEEERREVNRRNLSAVMLARSESITPVAIDLQMAHARRDRLRKRSLARTDAPRRFLEQVRCPVWVIYGQQDALYAGHIGSICAAAEELRLQRLVFIEQAGHWVQFEAPERFNQEVLDILLHHNGNQDVMPQQAG